METKMHASHTDHRHEGGSTASLQFITRCLHTGTAAHRAYGLGRRFSSPRCKQRHHAQTAARRSTQSTPPAGTPSVHAADGVSCMRCFLPLWPPALKHPSACRRTVTVTARARPRPAPPLHPGPSSSSASGRRSAARAPDCPPSPAAA